MRQIVEYTAEPYTQINPTFKVKGVGDYTAWRLIVHYDDGNTAIVKDNLTETWAAAMEHAGNSSLKSN